MHLVRLVFLAQGVERVSLVHLVTKATKEKLDPKVNLVERELQERRVIGVPQVNQVLPEEVALKVHRVHLDMMAQLGHLDFLDPLA